MLEHTFFPAVAPASLRYVRGEALHWLDNRFTDRFSPTLLMSYDLWGRAKPLPHFDYGEATILGDSGGYAVVTRNAKFDPTRVVRWQMKYCTRGVILDIPPYRPGSQVQFSGAAADYFTESLKRTQENVRRGLPYYLDHLDMRGKFRWWGVVQGETYAQMEKWFKGVQEVYPFTGEGEGWAAAPKPSIDLVACVRYLRFMRDHGVRRVHFLQITKPGTVAVLLALAMIHGDFDLITYDSATQTRAAINRMIVLDKGADIGYLKQTGEGPMLRHLMRECGCASCVIFKEHEPVLGKHLWMYLLLHNQITMKRVFNDLYARVAADPVAALRWGAGRYHGDVAREWEGEYHNTGTHTRTVSMLDRLQ